MSKPLVLIQKCDLAAGLRSMVLPPEDARRVHDLQLLDEVDHHHAADDAEFAALLPKADFVLAENAHLDATLIASAKRLRLIQVGGLRHDYLDLAAAKRAGIPVAAGALPSDVCVAEHTIMLMLALGKKLLAADRSAREGHWRSGLAPHVTSTVLSCLYGKTLGIVGLGEIARHVAVRARGFGVRLLYTGRTYGPEVEREYGIEFRPLRALLAESDIVSLHVPATPETRGMIRAAELALMKPHALLINAGRADVVEETALVDALKRRTIRGAGLDVYWKEPLAAGHPLAGLDNVLLTPHIAARGGMMFETLEVLFGNIRRVLRGEPLVGLIA